MDNKKIAEEFDVTVHLAKKARKLKEMKGILGEPDMKKGKILSDVVKAKVLEFYESDEYSQMCPGQKEFVSVKEGGERKNLSRKDSCWLI